MQTGLHSLDGFQEWLLMFRFFGCPTLGRHAHSMGQIVDAPTIAQFSTVSRSWLG